MVAARADLPPNPPKEADMAEELDPTAYTNDLRAAEATHGAEIEAIEHEANTLGGDITIGEIIAIMIRRGWQPPAVS